MSLRRDARGKRPQFYADPAMDQAMAMIMVLAEEYGVLRDRLDTVERVATASGLAAAIEAYDPPQAVLELREARRQAFLARLFYLARKDATDAAESSTDASYNATIADIAKG
jgi:hypothetical protein